MAQNPMMQMLRPSGPSNPLAMIAELKRFAAGMTPEKAEQEINRLLQTGQMSPQQLAALKDQAQAFMQLLR